jgi:tripartite-type tricarboxylate transporter receptor subunit TctC
VWTGARKLVKVGAPNQVEEIAMFKLGILAAVIVAGLATAVGPAAAQDDYPNRTVTVIVPWAAGGGADIGARVVFDELSKKLGQQFVLDFRPGASGTIGSAVAATAEPDGYTLLYTSGAPLVNAMFMPQKVRYNPETDLVPIALTALTATSIAAFKDAPFNTLDEMVAYAKANPGKISVAVSGLGGNAHAASASVEYKTGTKMTLVPYTGQGAMTADMMGGVTMIGYGFPNGFKPGVDSGKLKWIAVLSRERDPIYPEIPSSDESAFKGIYAASWLTAFAPKGTPRPIIDKLNKAMNEFVTSPEGKEKMKQIGFTTVANTPEEVTERLQRERAAMKELIDSGAFQMEQK